MKQSFRRGLVALLGAALVSGLAACGGGRSPGDAAAESAKPRESTDEFVELFSGGSFSYKQTEGPVELAASSDLVVMGRVTDIIPGRTYSGGLTTRVTFVVAVEQELTEAARPSTVYVEMPVSGGLPAEVVRSYLPSDLEMAFYLVPALTATEAPVDDESTGRPSGQPLYMPVNPDGALVAVSDSLNKSQRVTQLGGEQSYAEVDISHFLPPVTSWPDEYVHQGEGD